MDKKLRTIQLKVLKAFSGCSGEFALAGGTALELFYLHHRFSADLDFFSCDYSPAKIAKIVKNIEDVLKCKITGESEIELPGKARAGIYSLTPEGAVRSLKIDFVEEVLVKAPRIKRFSGIPVYDARDIYYQKIFAIAGTAEVKDEFGRDMPCGRNQPRDVFDLYALSRKIMPLSVFLHRLPIGLQRRMVHWYRSFSRQDLKLGLLDLDIYDRKFDAKEAVIYIENEIKDFIAKVLT